MLSDGASVLTVSAFSYCFLNVMEELFMEESFLIAMDQLWPSLHMKISA